MKYKVFITKKASKEILALPRIAAAKVYGSILKLETEPRPVGSKKLQGTDEVLWRIRVGDYRIIYCVEDTIKVVEVRSIGNRKDIYK